MTKAYEYSHKGIVQNIIREANALSISEGASQKIAERVAKKTDAWIKNKGTVTESDLRRVISKELEVISPDLAFAYRNHDKII